jgi:hypothetical protein
MGDELPSNERSTTGVWGILQGRRVRILYLATTGPGDPTAASWLTPPDFARMAADYDRVVSV